MFAEKVGEVAKKNFLSNCAQLIFVEDGMLVKYNETKEREEYPMSTGVAGHVAETQKPLIVPDISVTTFYNKKVDVYTLLPILVVPILTQQGKDQLTIGVLEISLRERRK